MSGGNEENDESTAGWKWSWSSGFPISDGVTRFEVFNYSFSSRLLFVFLIFF